jgi:hypothetical protein
MSSQLTLAEERYRDASDVVQQCERAARRYVTTLRAIKSVVAFGLLFVVLGVALVVVNDVLLAGWRYHAELGSSVGALLAVGAGFAACGTLTLALYAEEQREAVENVRVDGRKLTLQLTPVDVLERARRDLDRATELLLRQDDKP